MPPMMALDGLVHAVLDKGLNFSIMSFLDEGAKL